MPIATQSISHHQVRNHAIGQATTDANTAVDTSFAIGFTPRKVVFINTTDRITLEWLEGMAPDSALRTDATGARTFITTAGITANATIGGFSVKAAALPASKSFNYECIG